MTMRKGKMEFCIVILQGFPWEMGTTALEILDPQIYRWHSLGPRLMRLFEVGLEQGQSRSICIVL